MLWINNPFDQLQIWYSEQWEIVNENIIKIETLDNPGWILKINLLNLDLENKFFTNIDDLEREDLGQWLQCYIKDRKFVAAGGPHDLKRMVETFVNWVDKSTDYTEKNQAFEALQDWYLAQCNEDWEHIFGIRIETLDHGKWFVKIDLAETDLEDTLDPNTNLLLIKNENFFCKIENQQFLAEGTPLSLTAIIENFIHWKNSPYKMSKSNLM